ncbi:MAG: hypothetical protein BWK77_05215 [Verrucomicrobia bacterium A1]|nr:MAG: hypothetical protein BWK77_05215 [Verrucomicrobia bacterium A1]
MWFDPALRPAILRTEDGEEVTVEDPGLWNLEAGPDFLGAALRIGPGRRRITGDVEIHIHPRDWDAHGHRADPRYAGVRVHVTFFPGRVASGALPAGTVQLALKDPLAANPLFSFENVDLTAYPFGTRAAEPACLRVLREWPAEAKGALLDAAGEERLRRKAERLAAAIQEKGADQVLYEEVLCALGYKQNKAPFRHLAEQVPLAALREEANGEFRVGYAVLLGVAGLLPDQSRPNWDRATRAFVRSTWDAWWKRRERWEAKIMPAASWQRSGLRPANRPERRLMAAAHLFTRKESLAGQWLHMDIAGAGEQLVTPPGTYWDRRLSLAGPPREEPVALIGRTRADAIINNVFIPFLAAQEARAPFRKDLLDRLPAESDNAIMRQTAFSLFGPDHASSLCRSGLRRQGLLQIFHDFCLNDRSRCAACELPGMLWQHHA